MERIGNGLSMIWKGTTWTLTMLLELVLILWFLHACVSGGSERKGWR